LRADITYKATDAGKLEHNLSRKSKRNDVDFWKKAIDVRRTAIAAASGQDG
jgi:hypothetical protein